jgi:hypothetical protein
MKTRVVKNWKSTVVGVGLLVGAGAFLWFGKITMGEFTAFVPVCAGFIWVKDSVFSTSGSNDNAAA